MAESKGDVRILTGSSEMAVCAHAQYKFGQEQPRTSGGLQVAMHSQLPRFLVFLETGKDGAEITLSGKSLHGRGSTTLRA